MTWAIAALSLLATWLNVRGQRACFGIWLGTNAIWAATCATHGLPAQAALHVVYAGLAVWGLVRWARHPVARAKRGHDGARGAAGRPSAAPARRSPVVRPSALSPPGGAP